MPTDPAFPARLRELRQQAGMSLRQLAKQVPCSHVYIHQLEDGVRVPSSQMARRLDEVLKASGSLVAHLAEPVAADDGQAALAGAVTNAVTLWRGTQRSSYTWSAGMGAFAVWEWENPPEDQDVARAGRHRVELVDIMRLQRARDRYQEMYRRVGGVPTLPRITHLLAQQAAPLLRNAYDNDIGRRLFRTVGGLAALAGVCAYDADSQALAQQHLLTALRMAKASGDRGFGGYVVALLANQALHLGEHRLVVQYAESALRAAQGQLTPALVADLHALAGKAYARTGDTQGCHRHLRLSEATAARIDHGGEPAEVSYMTPGLVETQVAEALRRLGDLSAAQTYAEESVRTAPGTHLRGQVHRHAGLTLILTARDEVEHGAHVATGMLNLALGMESGRIRDRINTVATALRPHAQLPEVAKFLDLAEVIMTGE